MTDSFNQSKQCSLDLSVLMKWHRIEFLMMSKQSNESDDECLMYAKGGESVVETIYFFWSEVNFFIKYNLSTNKKWLILLIINNIVFQIVYIQIQQDKRFVWFLVLLKLAFVLLVFYRVCQILINEETFFSKVWFF